MFEGKVFKLDGKDYEIPPLALGDLRRFAEQGVVARAQAGTMSADEIDAQVTLITSALKRNYATVTEEFVGTVVDLGNLHPILRHIFGVSGLEPAAPGASGSP